MSAAVLLLVFALLGALVYCLTANAKASELGRLVFFAAMLALMFHVTGLALPSVFR